MKQSLSREDMILSLIRPVKYFAGYYYARLPFRDYGFFEDLVQSGWLGAIKAVDSYDTSRNVPLKIYARYRIKGAIIDFLRNEDWATRDTRKAIKTNNVKEVCFCNDSILDVCSIEDLRAKEEFLKIENSLFLNYILDSSNLSERNRYILNEAYFKERTLKTIGKDLKVNESRVSQLRSYACNVLKEKLNAL